MRRLISVLLLASTYACTTTFHNSADEEFEGSNVDNLRIELEDKLTVPNSQSDAVWYYMLRTYVASDAFLKKLNPNLKAHVNEEFFTDAYYDTPNHTLLERKMGLRHRHRLNLSDPENRKNGRELVQLKLNDISENELERGELKYRVNKDFSKREKSPITDLVAEKYQEKFVSDLQKIKIDANQIQRVLTIFDLRKRIYVTYNGAPYLSLSFDQVRLNKEDREAAFMEIEPELAEEVFTEADAAKKEEMKAVLASLVKDIRSNFPDIERNLTPKYGKAFALLRNAAKK